MDVIEFKNLTIKRQTKGRIPNLPFSDIKNDILGEKYDLSLLFPSKELSIKLHKKYKEKKTPVNVLSFPLDKENGEIVITLSEARNEAKKYSRNYHNNLIFLFIHGCLHLKGMDHSARMEKEEEFYYKLFSI